MLLPPLFLFSRVNLVPKVYFPHLLFTNRTPGTNHLKEKELQEIAEAMALTDAAVSAEVNEVPTFTLGFDFLGDDDEAESDARNNEETLGTKQNELATATEEPNPIRTATVGRNSQSNSVVFPRDRNQKVNFTRVQPFNTKQSKESQVSAGFTQKAEQDWKWSASSSNKELHAGGKKPCSLPKLNPVKDTPQLPVQRPHCSVHARPQTTLLSPLLSVRPRLVLFVVAPLVSVEHYVSNCMEDFLASIADDFNALSVKKEQVVSRVLLLETSKCNLVPCAISFD